MTGSGARDELRASRQRRALLHGVREGPLPWAIYTAILAQKDQDGISPVTPDVLAAIWRMDVEEIRRAWDVLAAPDPRSKNREHEGRPIIPTDDGRWLVVSHEKYRLKHREEQRKETVREAKRRQREREKDGTCDTPGCGQPAETAVAGRKVCSEHAFTADRQPGEEG
jgi:hypothetical protein